MATDTPSTVPQKPLEPADGGDPETLDPNDSALERDQLKGKKTQHANPPRLEDEGQSGG